MPGLDYNHIVRVVGFHSLRSHTIINIVYGVFRLEMTKKIPIHVYIYIYRYVTVFLREVFGQFISLLQIPRFAVVADARQAPGRHRQVHQLQTDVRQILPHTVHLVLMVVAIVQTLQVQYGPSKVTIVHRRAEFHETFVQVVSVVPFALLAVDLMKNKIKPTILYPEK